MVNLNPVSNDSEVQSIDTSSSSDISPGGVRLPRDIWPDIVSHLSFESIENVMFVCHYFRKLAQPSLFQMLAVKPFNMERYRRSSRNEVDIRWILQKLEFYSSPTIARHVQFCRISPNFLSPHPTSALQIDAPDIGRDIIDAVFELLSRFTNLIEVDFNFVRLTDSNIQQLSQIRCLNTALLRHCKIAATTPVRINVPTVLLNYSRGGFSTLYYLQEPFGVLSYFLQPNAVECLCIMGGLLGEPFFQATFTSPLHRLRTLCFHYTALFSFLPSLLRLPNLLEIILYTRDTTKQADPVLPSLSPYTVPHLERYDGPLIQVGCFGQGRPIRHLTFWGMNTEEVILRQLQALNSTADLESLEFHVNMVSELLLVALFDKHLGFPKLKALDIIFDYMDTKILTHVLPRIQLPPDIEHLSLVQASIANDSDGLTAELVPKKTYLTRYAALRYVAFSGRGYLWRFNPSTGAPLKTSENMEDWRKPALTKSMIERVSRIY